MQKKPLFNFWAQWHSAASNNNSKSPSLLTAFKFYSRKRNKFMSLPKRMTLKTIRAFGISRQPGIPRKNRGRRREGMKQKQKCDDETPWLPGICIFSCHNIRSLVPLVPRKNSTSAVIYRHCTDDKRAGFGRHCWRRALTCKREERETHEILDERRINGEAIITIITMRNGFGWEVRTSAARSFICFPFAHDDR